MRQLLFACALLLTACATPRASADELQAEPQLLRMCVTRADVDRAALESCKGVVTRACIEAEGGSNSMTDVLCRGAETDAWEALMNQAITRITLADAVDGDLVAAASQAWTPWREAECNYRAYEYGGGSGEQVDRAICYLDLTAARAIDLIAR